MICFQHNSQGEKHFCVFLASANEMSVSPGRRFMIDLLVSSLMADGGLESALNAAITAEIQVSMFYSLVTSSFIHPYCLIFATVNRVLPKNKEGNRFMTPEGKVSKII